MTAVVAIGATAYPEPAVDLSLHRGSGRTWTVVSLHREHASHGMFIGPIYVRASDADAWRRVLPRAVRRVFARPVGPWGMSGQSIGTSVAVAGGLYARF
jgi:hypothetical protein